MIRLSLKNLCQYIMLSGRGEIMPLGKNHLDSEMFTVFGIMASFQWLPVMKSGISGTECYQPTGTALMSKPRGGRYTEGNHRQV